MSLLPTLETTGTSAMDAQLDVDGP